MATQVSTFDKLIADLQKQQESANLANQKRYDQMLAIYDEVINRYQPGGTFQKAGLEQLGQQKTRDIGAETQQMIGSGLYGTTTTASLPSKWEREVGAPAKLNLEDVMMQRLSQAQIGKAGAIEGVSDVGPGYDLITNLAMQYGQGRTFTSPTQPSYGSGITLAPGAADVWNRTGAMFGGGNYTPTPQTPSAYQPNPNFGQSTGLQPTPYDPELQKKINADLKAGEAAGTAARTTGSLEQSVFAAKPPSWTGNYQTWKKAMDSYYASKGQRVDYATGQIY